MLHLSIQSRLNLLIGALLVLALAANILAIVWSAGPRIRAEDESIVRLARQTIDRALAGLPSSPDPARDLGALLDRLAEVRHVHVFLEPPPTGAAAATRAQTPAKDRRFPRWFANLIAAERTPVRVPVADAGGPLGTLVIAGNPADEIAEIWDAVRETLASGLILIAAVFALTTLAVRQALAPIRKLGLALTTMQAGDYAVELDATGPPELATISAKLADLAAALSRTRSENARLAEQIVSVEDHERRELARELHDEFGPYLFAIRANVTALHIAAQEDGPDAARRRKRCEAVLDEVSALQQLNRRVLQRLRPPALAELGLAGALESLAGVWRENNPQVAITLDIEPGLLPLDDTTALTVYRVVQEGLTNAFRHANAHTIAVAVAAGPGDRRLTVRVRDDGSGMAGAAKPGFGLSGMGERVWALGGTMRMTDAHPSGLALEVELPVPERGAPAVQAAPPATRGFVADGP
jgi:two-component system, NarL family, sensor histidine kinase UhpB